MATRKKATGKKRPAKGRKSAPRKPVAKKSAESFRVLDLLRNPILASVGAFSLAEEGLERMVKDLIDRGEASEREGRKIVDDYRKRATRARSDLEKNIDKRIADSLRNFRLPTKKDLDDLHRKVNTLERRIEKLLAQRG